MFFVIQVGHGDITYGRSTTRLALRGDTRRSSTLSCPVYRKKWTQRLYWSSTGQITCAVHGRWWIQRRTWWWLHWSTTRRVSCPVYWAAVSLTWTMNIPRCAVWHLWGRRQWWCCNAGQRWKLVIFRDPWPMWPITHDQTHMTEKIE